MNMKSIVSSSIDKLINDESIVSSSYLRPNNVLPNQTGSVPKTRDPRQTKEILCKLSRKYPWVGDVEIQEYIAFIQGLFLSESKQKCGENIAHFICIVKRIKRGFPLLQRIFSGEVNAQNIETLRRRLQMFLR